MANDASNDVWKKILFQEGFRSDNHDKKNYESHNAEKFDGIAIGNITLFTFPHIAEFISVYNTIDT